MVAISVRKQITRGAVVSIEWLCDTSSTPICKLWTLRQESSFDSAVCHGHTEPSGAIDNITGRTRGNKLDFIGGMR